MLLAANREETPQPKMKTYTHTIAPRSAHSLDFNAVQARLRNRDLTKTRDQGGGLATTEDDDDDDVRPAKSCMQLFTSSGKDREAAFERVKTAFVLAYPRMVKFLDGAMVYIISRNTTDLFLVYILKLAPAPFCGVLPSWGGDDCEDTTPSSALLHYFFGVLAVGTLCLWYLANQAAKGREDDAAAAIVPSLFGMAAGWALGAWFVRRLVEVNTGLVGCGDLVACGERGLSLPFIDLGLVLVALVVVTVVIRLGSTLMTKLEHHLEEQLASRRKLHGGVEVTTSTATATSAALNEKDEKETVVWWRVARGMWTIVQGALGILVAIALNAVLNDILDAAFHGRMDWLVQACHTREAAARR